MLSSDRASGQRMKKSGSNAEDEISLPEELLTDILLRMPARLLVALRCLSKYYRELIDSEDFKRKHYDTLIKTRPDVIIHPRNEQTVLHLDFESDDCKVTTLQPPFESEYRFLGCQRGILCYQVELELEEEEYLIFWNPFTGVSRWSSSDGGACLSYNASCVRYLFGHDSTTDDFKVVKIMCSGRERRRVYDYDCVMYSSNTESWTRPQGFITDMNAYGKELGLGSEIYEWNDSEVFIEGTSCLHILAREKDEPYHEKIVAFDFADEAINLISLPKAETDKDRADIGVLASWYGCLCVIPQRSTDHSLDAWMMKEYGVEQSWQPLYSIHPGYLGSFGFCVDNNGHSQVLLTYSIPPESKSKLCLYNVYHKQLSSPQGDSDWPHDHRTPQHFLYVPTRRQP